MLNNKKKCLYLTLLIMVTFISVGFSLYKINSFKRIIPPTLNIKIGGDRYIVASRGGLYKMNSEGKQSLILNRNTLSPIGIIVFREKLYFINKKSQELCSMDLVGENIMKIDKCSSTLIGQAMFKLGNHIYYYNSADNLMRIDAVGKTEEIDT